MCVLCVLSDVCMCARLAWTAACVRGCANGNGRVIKDQERPDWGRAPQSCRLRRRLRHHQPVLGRERGRCCQRLPWLLVPGMTPPLHHLKLMVR